MASFAQVEQATQLIARRDETRELLETCETYETPGARAEANAASDRGDGAAGDASEAHARVVERLRAVNAECEDRLSKLRLQAVQHGAGLYATAVQASAGSLPAARPHCATLPAPSPPYTSFDF